MIRRLRSAPRAVAAVAVLAALAVGAAIDRIDGGDDSRRAAEREPNVIDLGRLTPRRPPPEREDRPERRRKRRARGPSLARLVGMRVMTRMDGAAATPDLLRRARRGEIGGVIVFPGGADGRALASAIDRLQAAARDGGGPGLLVSTDQEGGSVKRFPAGPPGRAPGEMGSAGAAEQEGAATGEYLARLGINVDLAPVLDVPSVGGAFIASRAFGTTARDVALRGIAFAQGLAGAGVAGAAKHFPGLGSATANTDLQRSVISADARSLEAQLRPFRLAVDAAIPMVMVSSAVYSGYDRARPAVLSPRVVRRLLRRRLGFDGVVITDDLSSPAIASATTPAEAAVAFARAGGDVALYARVGTASDAGHDALLSAARAKRIPRSQLRASYRRIVALIELLGR